MLLAKSNTTKPLVNVTNHFVLSVVMVLYKIRIFRKQLAFMWLVLYSRERKLMGGTHLVQFSSRPRLNFTITHFREQLIDQRNQTEIRPRSVVK